MPIQEPGKKRTFQFHHTTCNFDGSLKYSRLWKEVSWFHKLLLRRMITEMPRIGVLALQGAFEEHCDMLRKVDADPVEVRLPEDMEVRSLQ
jgi:hypothetical protein